MTCRGSVLAAMLLLAACSSGSARAQRTRTPTTTSASDARSSASAPAPSAGCRATTATSQAIAMVVHGVRRTALVLGGDARSRPLPLLVLLHGLGQSADAMAADASVRSDPSTRGVVIAIPETSPPGALWQPATGGADDAMLGSLIARVEATRCIDRRRVAVAGFSAGSAFATAYACRNPARIAALITVSLEVNACAFPLPLLAFHGTADPIVPYGGGGLGGAGTPAAMQVWSEANGCAPGPHTATIGPRVRRVTWTHCAAHTELVTLVGAGHAWPDPAVDLSERGTPRANGTELVLHFAEEHRVEVGSAAFCAAARRLVALVDQIGVEDRVDLAAATALTSEQAHLLTLAAGAAQRAAVTHLTDAASEATQGRQPDETATAASTSARSAITAICGA